MGMCGNTPKSETPEYRAWSHMRARCKLNFKGYEHVQVCERWQDFDNFLADMGPRPSDQYSIDRYPNPWGHYEPGNCRWATRKQQSNNFRKTWHRRLAEIV